MPFSDEVIKQQRERLAALRAEFEDAEANRDDVSVRRRKSSDIASDIAGIEFTFRQNGISA